MNELINFIKTHTNWKELLQSDPYNLLIKEDPDFPDVYLFKYNQYTSDMNEKICQEARGIILEIYEDVVNLLCHSFDKFFNYGEPQGQQVLEKFNWNDYSFQEKRDGSLLRLWFYKGRYVVSTSGTIDAYKATIDIPSCPYNSFGDMFHAIYKPYKETLYPEKNITYSFEMTSPNNKIVVNYEDDELTLIGMRDINTNKELDVYQYNPFTNIKTPIKYSYININDALTNINQFKNFEGLVLCDNEFRRVKIKTDEYLALAKLADDTGSDRGILKLILTDQIDDIVSKIPHILPRVNIIREYLKNEITSIQDLLSGVDFTLSKKDLALKYKDNPYSSFIFKKYSVPEYDFTAYFNVDNLERIYKDYKNKAQSEN